MPAGTMQYGTTNSTGADRTILVSAATQGPEQATLIVRNLATPDLGPTIVAPVGLGRHRLISVLMRRGRTLAQ